MHSFALAQALDKLERANEILYKAEISGEHSNAYLAVLGLRVKAAERDVEEIKKIEKRPPQRTLNAEQVDLIMEELRRLVRCGCTPEEAARKMHRALLEEGYKI